MDKVYILYKASITQATGDDFIARTTSSLEQLTSEMVTPVFGSPPPIIALWNLSIYVPRSIERDLD